MIPYGQGLNPNSIFSSFCEVVLICPSWRLSYSPSWSHFLPTFVVDYCSFVTPLLFYSSAYVKFFDVDMPRRLRSVLWSSWRINMSRGLRVRVKCLKICRRSYGHESSMWLVLLIGLKCIRCYTILYLSCTQYNPQ